jgi:DNA-binding transcriptional ArsR family regulator
MKPTIKYKVDYDFISYTYVCANAKELKKQSLAEMKQHPSITKEDKKKREMYFKDAEDYYNQSLSYIQRNECDMFFKKTSIFKDFLSKVTMCGENLKDKSLSDFKEHILKYLDDKEENLNEETLLKALKNHYDDPNSIDDYKKETELILETLKDERMFESIFKNAVNSLRDLFIKERYEPNKEKIEAKLSEHNEKYVEEPLEFILKMSSGMIKEEDLKGSDVQPYLTYFTNYKLMISLKCETGLVIYNYQLEELNNEGYEKDIIQSLLKFLSDPKRYEMIQMLSKEKWYANELAKKFKITPATMSYHVNKLFALGLISFDQAEQNKLYIKLDSKRLEYLLNKVTKDLLN